MDQKGVKQSAGSYRGTGGFFARYSWLILRNIVGWVLVVSSVPVGVVFPGPAGTPMFLIGFALITFPGKRKLTSRVLRGKRIQLTSRVVLLRITVVSLFIPPWIVGFLAMRRHQMPHPTQEPPLHLLIVYLASIAASWLGTFFILWVANFVIGVMPRVRRRVRPWLQRRGINLLPPRRRRRSRHDSEDEEILHVNSAQVWGTKDGAPPKS